MPTARQPLIFAICPTTMPVAPAAPETTTVSPALACPTSSSPKYAVNPGLPHRFFHIIPVAALGQPDWPCRQTELMVGQVHSGSPFAVLGKAEATVYAPSRHSHHSEESASRPWWRSSRIQIGVILLPCTIGHDLACSNVLLLAAVGVSCIEYHAPSNVHTRCGGTVD